MSHTSAMRFRCAKVFSRHRKTIDPKQHVCGSCHGRLKYIGKFDRAGNVANAPAADGSAAAEGGGNVFSLFVKQHFATTKRSHPPGRYQRLKRLGFRVC